MSEDRDHYLSCLLLGLWLLVQKRCSIKSGWMNNWVNKPGIIGTARVSGADEPGVEGRLQMLQMVGMEFRRDPENCGSH